MNLSGSLQEKRYCTRLSCDPCLLHSFHFNSTASISLFQECWVPVPPGVRAAIRGGDSPYTCRGPRPPEGLRAPSRIGRMQEGVGVLHGCAGSPQVHYRRGVGCCCSVSLSSHQAHCCHLWLLLACAGTRKIAFTSRGCVYK